MRVLAALFEQQHHSFEAHRPSEGWMAWRSALTGGVHRRLVEGHVRRRASPPPQAGSLRRGGGCTMTSSCASMRWRSTCQFVAADRVHRRPAEARVHLARS